MTAVDASYREVAATLAPQAVSEYLAFSSWNLERRDDVKEIWQLAGDSGKPTGRLMLPLDKEYSDFRDRFYDALMILGRVNNWDADKLTEHILATRADLFFVRLDQSTADGTIPIRQAEITIDAIYKMLRSAATATAGIGDGGKRLPPAVTNFLEEDVRLGHTKRGSFIFTVAARVSDRLSANRTLADVNNGQVATDQVTASSDIKTPTPKAFSRQVMETLASSLEVARDISDEHKRPRRYSQNIVPISPGLLESLEEMAKPEGLRAVVLSFHWATAIPQPDIDAEPIELERGAVETLRRFRHELPPLILPPAAVARQTIVGPVRSLAREEIDENNDETGEIVVFADIGDGRKSKNVHVKLSGQDHEWAILAYRSKLPLTVSGDLVFERQRWRLVGDVEVDASFLKQIDSSPNRIDDDV